MSDLTQDELRAENEKLKQRINVLESWVRLSPHAPDCASYKTFMAGGVVENNGLAQPFTVTPECDCWKSEALRESGE